MHGRLKVKTTAEQEIEKEKERSIKLKKYLIGTNLLFSKKQNLEHDSEALMASSKLLYSNPDALTFWNFRRNVLLTLKRSSIDEEAWQKLLEDEMNVTETCLLKNPKSYGAWHHRDWLFNNFPMPPYEEELLLCDKFIQKDERNFHCWDHRRLIVNKSNRCLAKELAYTQELIEKNFSNFSAWHYRSKLLPVLHPPTKGSSHPIQEEIFIKELEKVFAAVFTDPSDQSPWFFLRWLISKREENPRLIQVGVLPSSSSTKLLVFVFSKLVTSIKDLIICIDDEVLNLNCVEPIEGTCIWMLPFTSSLESNCIKVSHKQWFSEQEFKYNANSFPSFKWISKELACQRVFSKESEKMLFKIMDDCIQLDKLDPGNKWVLLTLVDIMSALNIRDYQKDILLYLNQLEILDFLRINYYRDVRSRVLSEAALITYIENETSAFALTSRNLTTLTSSQFLCSAEIIDLSDNCLLSLTPIVSMLNCRELTLDGNIVRDLTPLSKLKYLRKLSMNSCKIDSVELLLPLSSCDCLLELLIEDNPISKIDDVTSIIINFIPNLVNIKL